MQTPATQVSGAKHAAPAPQPLDRENGSAMESKHQIRKILTATMGGVQTPATQVSGATQAAPAPQPFSERRKGSAINSEHQVRKKSSQRRQEECRRPQDRCLELRMPHQLRSPSATERKGQRWTLNFRFETNTHSDDRRSTDASNASIWSHARRTGSTAL